MAASSDIEGQGATKVFGGEADTVRALDRGSVTIRENGIFTLLGPSGCGKTTLLGLIAGLGLPRLFVSAGGYAVEAIGINAVNVLSGFEAAA